jgi:hypothetical protein
LVHTASTRRSQRGIHFHRVLPSFHPMPSPQSLLLQQLARLPDGATLIGRRLPPSALLLVVALVHLEAKLYLKSLTNSRP